MKKFILLFFLQICLTNNILTNEMKSLVPDKISGWKSTGEDKTYNPENIFDYINGAGEVYRSYNFQEVFVRKYTKPASPSITVDLFNMGSSEDAFGVFTHDREGDDIGIGQDSYYRAGLLSFWKDKYFVSIVTEEETDSSKRAIFSLGMSIANSIKNNGSRPELLKLLPSQGLITNSLKYFHNNSCLNYHYFLSNKNILELSQETNVILSDYKHEGKITPLLLIQYADTNKPKLALKNFLGMYGKETKYFQGEEKKWIGAEIYKNLIIIILDSPTKSYIKELIKKIKILSDINKK